MGSSLPKTTEVRQAGTGSARQEKLKWMLTFLDVPASKATSSCAQKTSGQPIPADMSVPKSTCRLIHG